MNYTDGKAHKNDDIVTVVTRRRENLFVAKTRQRSIYVRTQVAHRMEINGPAMDEIPGRICIDCRSVSGLRLTAMNVAPASISSNARYDWLSLAHAESIIKKIGLHRSVRGLLLHCVRDCNNRIQGPLIGSFNQPPQERHENVLSAVN